MAAERAHSSGRRVQLAAAIVAMVCIAPLQYSWTLFTTPLEQQNPWSLPQVQLAFTFFIVAQTLSQPLGGYFMDRRGPRLAFIVAAVLIVVGWGGLGVTGSRPLFYALYSLAGVGAGIVYAGAIGTGIRWFPNRRGLALGLIAAGFGVGAAPFTPFAHRLLEGYGVRPAFVVTGLVIGAAVLVVGLLLKTPPVRPAAVAPATAPGTTAHPSAHEGLAPSSSPGAAPHPSSHEGLAPLGLLRLGQFWLAFVAFFCMATGLLILTANTRPIGEDFGITASVIVVALVLQQLLNGASRVVWGWVSDRFGRELTMTVAFALTGLFLCLIPVFGSWPPAFVDPHGDGLLHGRGDVRPLPRPDRRPLRLALRGGQPGHALHRQGARLTRRRRLRRLARAHAELGRCVRARRGAGLLGGGAHGRDPPPGAAGPRGDGTALRRGSGRGGGGEPRSPPPPRLVTAEGRLRASPPSARDRAGRPAPSLRRPRAGSPACP